MSRKTDEIKKSLAELEKIQERLAQYSNHNPERQLDDIQFELKTQIHNLRSWIEMLYQYNGKSKSRMKVAASRENGKKGGRPPKALSELRKRKAYLEELIPQTQRKISLAQTNDEEVKLAADKTIYEIELGEIETKISEFKR